MTLLAPGALWFGLAVPFLLLLYFLRWKREPRSWSTLLFWKQLLREQEADSLWKKLQRDLLLWLQLMAVLLFVGALIHPAIRGAEVTGGDVILVLDRSASMQAPARVGSTRSRFELARRFALDLVGRLPASSRVAILTADVGARLELSWSRDRGRAKQTLARLTPTDLPTTLPPAVVMALALAQGSPSTRIYLLGDSTASLASLPLPAAAQFIPFGEPLENTAIVGLALPPKRGVIRILAANFGKSPKDARLEVRLNGEITSARELKLLPGQLPVDLVRPAAEGTLEVSLRTDDPFPLDNTVWAMLAPERPILVRYHGGENRVLFRVLAALGRYERALGGAASNEVVEIADATAPRPRSGNLLVLGGEPPPEVGGFKEWQEGAILTHPDRGHPVTRLVTLEMPVAEKLARITPSPRAVPILWSGTVPAAYLWESVERKIAYLAFDPRRSSWPRRPSFVIFLDQVLRYLSPRDDRPYWKSGSAIGKEGKQGIADRVGIRDGTAVNLLDEEESRLTVSPPLGGTSAIREARLVPGWRDLWPFLIVALLPLLFLEWMIYHRRRRR